jgi:trk system potassium uptake protein TrkA
MIKDDGRLFSFIVTEADAGPTAALALPKDARVICYYRVGRFALADEDDKLRAGDEVVILTHARNLEALQERWQPRAANSEPVK